MSQAIGRVLQNCRKWLMPFAFCTAGAASFALFYLGLAYVENPVREYGFIIVSVIAAVLTGLNFLYLVFKEKKVSVWRIIVLFGVLALFFACFAIWYLNFGTKGELVSRAEQFAVFGVSALLAGVCVAAWETEHEAFANLEAVAFFYVPAALIYVNGALLRCSPFNGGHNLGIINYMSFSYALLPVLLSLLFRFSEKAELRFPFTKYSFKRPQLVRGLMIALFWIAIIAAGTRGTYFCVAIFCICWAFSSFIHKEPEKKRVLGLSAAMITVLLFNVFVYAPSGMAVGRMDMFVEGIKNGEIVTAKQSEEITKDVIDALVEENSGGQLINRKEDSQDAEFLEESIGAHNYKIGNRGTLYKLAWREFLKSPVTGMGPGGYAVKYGMYPHNAILEILCETGIVGGVLFLGMTVWAVIRLLMIGAKRKDCRWAVLFLIAFAVEANISGSLWNCPALMFALGYGIVCPRVKENLPVK